MPYHTALSPKDQLWEKSKFEKYSAERSLPRTLFINGPDDVAIVRSTYLKDFYKNGFNTIRRNAEVANAIGTLPSSTAPSILRDGEKALEYIRLHGRRPTTSKA